MENVRMSKDEIQARVILLSHQIEQVKNYLNEERDKKLEVRAYFIDTKENEDFYKHVVSATRVFFDTLVAEQLKTLQKELNAYLISK